LLSGQKNINRRRMADFIEDSLAQALVQFAKLPMTTQLRDGAESETNAFLEQLLSPNNPAAQRIDDFKVDPVSGNTPELEALGIFVLVVSVRTLPTADFIVLQAQIGEGVVITRTERMWVDWDPDEATQALRDVSLRFGRRFLVGESNGRTVHVAPEYGTGHAI